MYRLKAHIGYAWLVRVLLLVAGVGVMHGQQENGQKWPGGFTVGGAVSSSAAISLDGKTVYVGIDAVSFGRVVAINLADLTREKWKFERPDAFDSSPAVGPDGTVYIGCDDGKLYALNGETGDRLWAYDTSVGGFVFSSPAIGADGTIYFGAGDSKLHAVSKTGNRVWTFPTDGYIDSSPAIGPDGTIYFGSSDRKFYAVTPNGTAKWPPFVTGGSIVTSPAIGPDGTIYFGSKDLKLYALAPDGTKKWDYDAIENIYVSPVVGVDGTVYIAARQNFYALNPRDGSEKWNVGIGTTTGSTPAIRGDGTLVFGADDHKVHFLNADGTQRPSFDTGIQDDLFDASPLIGPDGTIYIGSLRSGKLYALNGNGSPLSAYASWPAFRRDATHTGRALPTGTGQLINIAARAQVSASSTLIAGLAVSGVSEKAYLIRGVGPTLTQFGVTNPMTDPQLALFVAGNSIPKFRNDNWNEQIPPADQFGLAGVAHDVGAFALPENSKDAALIALLGPGLYTAHVSSANQQGGVVLLEAYDAIAGDSTARIVNLSTRGRVGTGGDVLIPGVVVGGTGTVRLLVRGVGPGLSQFDVPDVLARPSLTVFSGTKMLATNTGWSSGGLTNDLSYAAQQVGAFPLADKSADSALILDATAGQYTIQVSGVGGTIGEALVEVYVLP